MSKIREMLIARKTEINNEIAALRGELAEISSALWAMSNPGQEPPQRKNGAASIADQVEAVLADEGDLTSAEVRRRIKSQFGRDVPARSVSWNLSHLKRHGRVELDGSLWRLRSNEAEGSDVAASEPSIESQEGKDLLG